MAGTQTTTKRDRALKASPGPTPTAQEGHAATTTINLPRWVTVVNTWIFGLVYTVSNVAGYMLASPFMVYHAGRQAYREFVEKRGTKTPEPQMNTDTANYDENGNVTSLSSSYPVQASSLATEFSADDSCASVIRVSEGEETSAGNPISLNEGARPLSVVSAVRGGESEEVTTGESK